MALQKHTMTIEFIAEKETEWGAVPIEKVIALFTDLTKTAYKYSFECFYIEPVDEELETNLLTDE